MTKLCTLCQLFLVIGLAGSSNAAWPLQTRIDDAVARHGAEVCPRRGREIVVRPDHGRKLDIDRGRTCYYGYDYGGRLIGISELRGLEAGIKFMARRSG